MAKECPVVTHDIKLNLKNRDWAFKNVGYGPANPDEPNKEFWSAKSDEWQTPVETAKTMRCGNCSAFIQTPEMMDCIVSGIQGEESDNETYASEVVASSNIGYCELFEFKCAADRVCSAWLIGGPTTKPMTTKEYVAWEMAHALASDTHDWNQ